jgi:hypothetical protein
MAAPRSSNTSPQYVYCPAGDYYYVDSNDGWFLQPVPTPSTQYANYNGTPYTATMTLTSTQSGTVGVSVSVGGTFDISAIVAGAQASTSATLTSSQYAGVGNSISFSVPPYEYGVGQYGVWRLKTYGEYYYETNTCQTQDIQYFYTWVPRNASGWNVWDSTSP